MESIPQMMGIFRSVSFSATSSIKVIIFCHTVDLTAQSYGVFKIEPTRFSMMAVRSLASSIGFSSGSVGFGNFSMTLQKELQFIFDLQLISGHFYSYLECHLSHLTAFVLICHLIEDGLNVGRFEPSQRNHQQNQAQLKHFSLISYSTMNI